MRYFYFLFLILVSCSSSESFHPKDQEDWLKLNRANFSVYASEISSPNESMKILTDLKNDKSFKKKWVFKVLKVNSDKTFLSKIDNTDAVIVFKNMSGNKIIPNREYSIDGNFTNAISSDNFTTVTYYFDCYSAKEIK